MDRAPAPEGMPGTPADLRSGLDRQRELYRRLFAHAVRQRDALRSGDTAALLPIVEEKRSLLAAGEEVDRALAPWRERWAELRGHLDADDRAGVDALVGQVEEVLRALLAIEEECTRMVEEGLTVTRGEIQKVTDARKLQSAYHPPAPPPESRFLDRTE